MTRLLENEKAFLEKVRDLLNQIQEDLGPRTVESRSITSVQLLMCINAILAKQPKMSELVDILNVSTSTLYKTTNKLIEIGYCEKVRDPEDARIRRLKVTPKFEKFVRNVS